MAETSADFLAAACSAAPPGLAEMDGQVGLSQRVNDGHYYYSYYCYYYLDKQRQQQTYVFSCHQRMNEH